jgi:hypothetical protein
MASKDTPQVYGAHYFAHSCGRPYERNEHWLSFFGSIAERIASDIRPSAVLDAGCAMGFLVESLRRLGIEAWGIDVSEYAIQNVHPDMRPYCWVGSVLESFPRQYDLIVCIEVLEHMQQAESENAVANLCRHSDDILFSSTPVDYRESTHFNVQQPEYWAEMFCRQGFLRDADFDASLISPWAARFRRRLEPLPRIVKEYERKFWQLWKENVDLRGSTAEKEAQLESMEAQLASMEPRLASMEAQLAAREKSLEAQTALAAEKDQAISALRRTLDDIVNSKSWRLMQKLQRMRRLLSREQ